MAARGAMAGVFCWMLIGACGGAGQVSKPAEEPRTKRTPEETGAQVPLGSCECALEVRERGNALWKSGQYEEALAEFLTCPREHLPNLAGLAEDYPPVWGELRNLRDEVARRVTPPRVDDAVKYLDELNFILNDHVAAAELFETWLPHSDLDRRALQRLIWRDLVEAQRYDYALTFEDMIRDGLYRSQAYLLELRAEKHAHVPDVESVYTWTAVAYSAALFGEKRDADALDVVTTWTSATGHEVASKAFCEMIEEVGRLLDKERRLEMLEAVAAKLPGQSCGAESRETP